MSSPGSTFGAPTAVNFGDEQRGSQDLPIDFRRKLQGINAPAPPTEVTLQKMLQLMEEGIVNEASFPVLKETGVVNYQLLTTFDVPFDYNSIVLTVIGGIVAVSCNQVIAADNGAGLDVVDLFTPYDYAFGSYASSPGSANLGANFTPISLFTGPQEIRFSKRSKGRLSFWVHPFSQLDQRALIDASGFASTLEMVGQVQYIP